MDYNHNLSDNDLLLRIRTRTKIFKNNDKLEDEEVQ